MKFDKLPIISLLIALTSCASELPPGPVIPTSELIKKEPIEGLTQPSDQKAMIHYYRLLLNPGNTVPYFVGIMKNGEPEYLSMITDGTYASFEVDPGDVEVIWKLPIHPVNFGIVSMAQGETPDGEIVIRAEPGMTYYVRAKGIQLENAEEKYALREINGLRLGESVPPECLPVHLSALSCDIW